MFWRVLTVLVLAFWLVMATLLVRVTYFPEGSQFSQLPPAAVFKTFLDHGATINALHVYQGERKLGHATLTPRRAGATDYLLLVSCALDKGALRGMDGPVAWRLNLNLRNGSRWGGASGQVRLPDEGVLVKFDWAEGSPVPEFTMHRHGKLVTDDKALQPFLGQITAGHGAPGVASGSGVGPQGDLLKVTAREGDMKIAGQRRKGYVIEFSLLQGYRVKAFFTEAGELALVDLPEGYRALEPVIHGLVPVELDEEN